MSGQEDGSFMEIINQYDFEDNNGYGWIMLWLNNIGDNKITLSTLKISVTNAEFLDNK